MDSGRNEELRKALSDQSCREELYLEAGLSVVLLAFIPYGNQFLLQQHHHIVWVFLRGQTQKDPAKGIRNFRSELWKPF